MSDHCRHMRADVEACCQFLASLVPTVEKSLRSNKFTVGATAPEYSLGIGPFGLFSSRGGGSRLFCAAQESEDGTSVTRETPVTP